MKNEYKVYIVGDKDKIDMVLNKAQSEDLIEGYQIEDT